MEGTSSPEYTSDWYLKLNSNPEVTRGQAHTHTSRMRSSPGLITGTYDIPADLDPATALILKEIRQMGLKIMNGEGNDIIITPAEFTLF
jgi:hypothetical protein